MDFSATPVLKNSRFTQSLIRKNGLGDGGFKKWVFCPGMLFNAIEKWWGDQGRRNRPHEGLDLCLYKDRDDAIHGLGQKTKIPAIFDGVVVRILDDFLGKSVFIEHLVSDGGNNKLCTIYGHTTPTDDIRSGKTVKAGDIIATLADSSKSGTDILPHLHISLGWTSKVISYDRLDWQNIGAADTLTLLDPLLVIDWPYLILAQEQCENVKPADPARVPEITT